MASCNSTLMNSLSEQIMPESNQNNCNARQWEEIEIPVPWGKVAGKWWGSREKQPVLALHGWQDNAGTFDLLCPLLPHDIPILCIDLPGHGMSSHYPSGMHYYIFWDGIPLIRRIIQYFNWKNITLMGHSLGGALVFMYAAIYPNEVSKFISLDMAGPAVRNPKRNAQTNGDSIDKFLSYEKMTVEKMPIYNYNDMRDLVLDAYGGSIDRNGAEVLLKRGIKPAPEEFQKGNDEKFIFSRDVRLKVATLAFYTTEQVLVYAERIKCKVLNIRGMPGMKFENPSDYDLVIETLRKNAEKVIYKQVSGPHHIHLVYPSRISSIISEFLQE